MAEVYCLIAGVPTGRIEFNIYPRLKDYQAVSFIKPDTISIVANAGWKNKMWPYEKWSELSSLLVADGYNIIQLGGPGQPAIKHAFYLSESTVQKDCAALSKCILHLGVDTFSLHASLATKTRRCILFGPTSPHTNPGFIPIYMGSDGVALEGPQNDINAIQVPDVYRTVKGLLKE